MSRWTETYNNHPIHATLAELMENTNVEPSELDEEEAAELRRLIKLLNFVEKTLQAIDPEIVPAGQLNTINSSLQHNNLRGQLQAYAKSNGSKSHLAAANNHIDGTMPAILQLRSLAASDTNKVHLETSDDLLDRFVTKAREQQELLDAKSLEQETGLAKLESERAALQEQLSGLETNASTKLETIEASFNTAEATREATYSTWFTGHKTNATSEAETYFGAFQEDIDKKLEEAREKQSSILELVRLASGDAVAAGYLSDGGDERSRADRWRKGTICFICLAVIWQVFAFIFGFTPLAGDLDHLTSILKAAPITAILLGGAAYAARQSKIHRDTERRARWFGLEMKALDPYIDSLNDEQKQILKKTLAERFFGQHTHDAKAPKVKKGDANEERLFGLLEAAINQLGPKGGT